jgi:hypothetical protein
MSRNSDLMGRSRRLTVKYFSVLILLFSVLVSPLYQVHSKAASAPTPISPGTGEIVTATGYGGSLASPPVAIPEFIWTPIEGTTKYRLQLSQDVAFATYIEFTTANTHFTPLSVNPFNDGTWYWRVRVDAPVASDYSTAYSFQKQWASLDNYPHLISPAEGDTVEFYGANTFSWQPVIGASSYRLQISTAPDFSSLAYDHLTITTRHQPLAKLDNGTYYWRVIPINPANREGTPSAARMFVQGYNQVPVLLEPADESLPTFTPTFRWTAVSGAQFYRLEYSTDPSFNTNVTRIDTRNTTFTPVNSLANDTNYYWRVRTHSGKSVSDWSTVWMFRKNWNIQPQLLTPVNNYQHVRFPLFSWTPVPGAAYYKVEWNTINSFPSNSSGTTSNTFFTPDHYNGDLGPRYWRVTAFDKNNNAGVPSAVYSFVSSFDAVTAHPVYPLYYYTPRMDMQPHEDRTVSLPIFKWSRINNPAPDGGLYTQAYRLEVSTSPLFFDTIWSLDTENLSATPNATHPFAVNSGTTYYWRVCPLDAMGGDCHTDPSTSLELWSQIWKTRIDLSQGLTPTSGAAPQLLRPVQADEFVETTPLLEWWPYQGADNYEVQISTDAGFAPAAVVDSEVVQYPAYTPQTSLAQRSLNRFDFGTFYWRVRARSGSTPISNWSTPWRFQIASQSEWMLDRTIGDPSNRLKIASDADDVADNNYELTGLYAAQSGDNWYFGFNVVDTTANMVYALYLDQDNQENSGATGDPLGYSVPTINSHLPEYAIYVYQTTGSFSASYVSVYPWNGSGWNDPQALNTIGGALHSEAGYVEIEVPNTAIGMQDETGSYSVVLFSLPSGSGSPQDSVPSNTDVPGGGTLKRFSSVSEHMNIVMPFDTEGNDPSVMPSVLPFFWDYPSGANPATPWAGATMIAYLDPEFTTQAADFKATSNAAYYASISHAWENDLKGDNTYYWRIRPRYLTSGGAYLGAWSQGWRFERQGFVPQNLVESVTFATPTFSWDRVEGAEEYELQVDNDPNFGGPEINIRSTQNSYTFQNTLSNGTYFWRARVRRRGNIVNEWSPSKSFTLSLPTPDGLTPNDPHDPPQNVVGGTPTLCWNHLLISDNGDPALAAYRYRVEVSKGDPTFSNVYERIDSEQNCYTPSKGYDDGQYYWRVAMMDGMNKLGDFSDAAVFTKQYPVATPSSPTNGSVLTQTPTFTWGHLESNGKILPYVYGAASYRLEVSLYPTFAPLYESITTHNTRYTPTKAYDTHKTYYWRVAIIDKDNKIGPFNDATIILDPSFGKLKLYLPMLRR